MLAIQLPGKGFLELPTDFQITINYNFNLFTFEEVEGSWALPFSLPPTAKNLKLLVIIATGTLKVEVANTMIEGHIEIGNGNFWGLTKDKKLNELPLGKDFTPSVSGEEYNYLNNSNANEYPDYDYAMYQIYAPNFHEVVNSQPVYINYSYGIKIPQPYLSFVLKLMFEYFGYTLLPDNFIDNSEFKQLCITTLSGNVAIEYPPVKHYFRFWDLPPVGIQELIIAIEKLLCVRFVFSHYEKTVNIIDLNQALTSAQYTDITNIASPPSNTVYEDDDAYVLKQITDTEDAYAVSNKENDFDVTTESYISDFTIPEPNVSKTEHPVECTYLAEDTYKTFNLGSDPENNPTLFTYTKMLCPRTDYVLTEEKPKPPIKLIFYRGLRPDNRYTKHDAYPDIYPVPGYTYPYATASNLDDQGIKMEGCEHTLYWAGEYGLFEKRWKNYFFWLQNIKHTEERNIDFSATQIQNLKPEAKERIDGTNYIVNKMEVSYSIDRMLECNTQLFKV